MLILHPTLVSHELFFWKKNFIWPALSFSRNDMCVTISHFFCELAIASFPISVHYIEQKPREQCYLPQTMKIRNMDTTLRFCSPEKRTSSYLCRHSHQNWQRSQIPTWNSQGPKFKAGVVKLLWKSKPRNGLKNKSNKIAKKIWRQASG